MPFKDKTKRNEYMRHYRAIKRYQKAWRDVNEMVLSMNRAFPKSTLMKEVKTE